MERIDTFDELFGVFEDVPYKKKLIKEFSRRLDSIEKSSSNGEGIVNLSSRVNRLALDLHELSKLVDDIKTCNDNNIDDNDVKNVDDKIKSLEDKINTTITQTVQNINRETDERFIIVEQQSKKIEKLAGDLKNLNDNLLVLGKRNSGYNASLVKLNQRLIDCVNAYDQLNKRIVILEGNGGSSNINPERMVTFTEFTNEMNKFSKMIDSMSSSVTKVNRAFKNVNEMDSDFIVALDVLMPNSLNIMYVSSINNDRDITFKPKEVGDMRKGNLYVYTFPIVYTDEPVSFSINLTTGTAWRIEHEVKISIVRTSDKLMVFSVNGNDKVTYDINPESDGFLSPAFLIRYAYDVDSGTGRCDFVSDSSIGRNRIDLTTKGDLTDLPWIEILSVQSIMGMNLRLMGDNSCFDKYVFYETINLGDDLKTPFTKSYDYTALKFAALLRMPYSKMREHNIIHYIEDAYEKAAEGLTHEMKWGAALISSLTNVNFLMSNAPITKVAKVQPAKGAETVSLSRSLISIPGDADGYHIYDPAPMNFGGITLNLKCKSKLLDVVMSGSFGKGVNSEVKINTTDGDDFSALMSTSVNLRSGISSGCSTHVFDDSSTLKLITPSLRFKIKDGGAFNSDTLIYDVNLCYNSGFKTLIIKNTSDLTECSLKLKVNPPSSLPLTSVINENSNFKIVTANGNVLKDGAFDWKSYKVVSDGSERIEAAAAVNLIDFLNLNLSNIYYVYDTSFVEGEALTSVEIPRNQSNSVSAQYNFNGLFEANIIVNEAYSHQGKGTYPDLEIEYLFHLSKLKLKKSSEVNINALSSAIGNNSICIFLDKVIFTSNDLSITLNDDFILKMSYLSDPLHIGVVDYLDLDKLKMAKYLNAIGDRVQSIEKLLNDVNARLDAIEAAVSSGSSSFMGMLNIVAQLSMFMSPIVALMIQGVVTVVSVAMMTQSGFTTEGLASTAINLIMFAISARGTFGLVSIRDKKLDKFNYFWDLTAREVKEPVTGVKYRRLNEDYVMVNKNIEASVITEYTKMDVFSGPYSQYIQKIQQKIHSGTATKTEKCWFDVHARSSTAPMHYRMKIITDKPAASGGYERWIHVMGVAEGNALGPSDAYLTGSGKINIGNLKSDAYSPGFFRIKVVKDVSGTSWKIADWRESGMTKAEILKVAGIVEKDAYKTYPDDLIQSHYESLCMKYEHTLSGNDKPDNLLEHSVKKINLLPGQIEALQKLIYTNQGNFSYRLLGNNCQVFVREMEGLLYFNKKPGRWVTNDSYKMYLNEIYNNL